MFDKCIPCKRIGLSCVPNLMLLPFPELIKWCFKRQKYLGWSNQELSQRSGVPLGTINRLYAGVSKGNVREDDCRYSTIRDMLITLIGGTKDEFSCTEQVENELRHMELLEQQAAKLAATEAECSRLQSILDNIDDKHRADIRAIKAEYQEEINFLKEEVKAWRSMYQNKQ